MNISDPLQKHFRLTARQANALGRVGITTVRDLLFYFPSRYEEFVGEKTVSELKAGERATLYCEIVKIKSQKTWKTRINIAEAIVKDDTGMLRVTWFNQPYVAQMLPEGTRVRLAGKIGKNKNGLYLANPTFELSSERKTPLPYQESGVGTLLAVYPETYGITSRWLGAHTKRILENVLNIDDAIPEYVLKNYHLPKISLALRAAHFPRTLAEAEAARKRFSFEEIFIIQLARQRDRKKFGASPSFKIETPREVVNDLISSLPFRLTHAQDRVLSEILADFKKPHPMARLIEGDVGSGKTIVAAGASLAVAKAGMQVAMLAPTEILARQHFDEFSRRLSAFRVPLGLLTSSEARKFPSKVNPKLSTNISKNQLLRWIASGEIKVLIGTHALIQPRVRFKKLGFVIVDEQHRFGTQQRHRILDRNSAGPLPHFLSMSATPIPRTLALTLYGDLDLSLIDEMPRGRKPVKTKVVLANERKEIYEFIRKEIKNGAQAFVVCPKIEDAKKIRPWPASSSLWVAEWDDVKSVKAEFKKLSEEIFPDLRVGIIHGKLTPKEKEKVMRGFRVGLLDILVATSVVEVGVDIPNASIMVIEGGERFGLATLHQFRGRVGRKGQEAYCFVFTSSSERGGLQRLRALEGTKTGFELAEYDLQFRGPGELAGKRQWGISDVGMEALKNIKMVEAARSEATRIIDEDPELKKYPLLKERVEKLGAMHFE